MLLFASTRLVRSSKHIEKDIVAKPILNVKLPYQTSHWFIKSIHINQKKSVEKTLKNLKEVFYLKDKVKGSYI